MSDSTRAERAVAALFAGLLGLAASRPIGDNSLFTHLATGRLQVDGGLPAQNPFLWTSTDFPVPSWWWSGLLGWTEHLVGLAGVRMVTVVVAATLGWLLVRVSRPAERPDEPASRVLALLLPPAVTVVLLAPFLNGRPHLAGFACLAVTLVVWRERLPAWILAPVFLVWVNVHGSWLYGAAVLGLLFVSESIDRRKPDLSRWRWLAAVVVGLVVGGLAYPERFRLVLLPTEQFGSEEARQAVRLYIEWQPLGFADPLSWVFLLLVALGLYGALRSGGGVGGRPDDIDDTGAGRPPERVAAVVGAGRPESEPTPTSTSRTSADRTPAADPRRSPASSSSGATGTWKGIRWGSAVAVAGLALMGMGAMRLLPIAAISLTAFATSGIEGISRWGLPSPRLCRFAAVTGGLLLAAALVHAGVGPHLDLGDYPVAEVDWLEERGLVADPDVALVAPDYVGNYLELRFGERAHAWVDDRPSSETFLAYGRLRYLDDGWRATLGATGADVVLWEREWPLSDQLHDDPDWTVGLTTDDYVVFCRSATVGPRCSG